MEETKILGINVDEKHIDIFKRKESSLKFPFTEIKQEGIKVNKEQFYNEEAIHLLIENDNYYSQLIHVLKNSSRRKINVSNIKDVKMAANRTEFVAICLDMFNKGKLRDIRGIEEKIKELEYSVSFEKLIADNPKFEFEVENNTLSVNTKEFVDAFRALTSIKMPLAQSKRNRVFMYGMRKFLEKSDVVNNVLLNENQKDCAIKIMRDEYVDTYSIDEVNKIVDNVDTIKLHSDLENYIFRKMPKDYTKLEKAIYIYIKLCRMATYDAEFYAEGQSEEINKVHMDQKRISTITPTNNVVVCYEINKIYAELLKRVGINYEVKAELGEYGKGHSNLVFKANDVIVHADTVSTILGSDILNTKTHSEIKGLTCRNVNKEMQGRFKRTMTKVYDDIKKNEPSPYVEGDTIDKWSELLTIFIEDPVDVTMKEKIDLFTDVAKTNTLPLTEKIAYLTKVYNKMFSKDKMTYMTIVSQKKENERFKKPTLVITYNDVQKITLITHNKYVLLDDGEWKHIPRATLQNMFNNGKLSYISNHTIPGIYQPKLEDIKDDQPN